MPTTAAVLDLIAVQGPWLLFLLAVAETSFVTGIFVPSGIATAFATVVAVEGGLSLFPIVLAAALGAAFGDSLGFWVGRAGHERWQDGTPRFARQVRLVRNQASRWFGRHPFLSVTIARLISFVRTVMPMTAGMSDLPYRRFLAYDLAGVALWVGLYVTAGVVVGRGWTWATGAFGMGGALLAVGPAALAIWLLRRRRARRAVPAGRRGT